MDNPKQTQSTVQPRKISVSPRMATEIDKLRQAPHLSKAQVNKILEVTRGDITGLRVGRRQGTKTVWIVCRGRRFDIDRNGALARQEKLGRPNPNMVKAMAKNLKCPLCGEGNNVPAHEIMIKCSKCGFPLRRVRVKMR